MEGGQPRDLYIGDQKLKNLYTSGRLQKVLYIGHLQLDKKACIQLVDSQKTYIYKADSKRLIYRGSTPKRRVYRRFNLHPKDLYIGG